MCRFMTYSGPATFMSPLVFQAENSLVSQSKSAQKRRKPVNADGFGIGWYTTHDDIEPAIFVSIDPAWSNCNLKMISTKIPTDHYFAHVRDASDGLLVNQANCHPFQKGKYLWMHNGHLEEFNKIKRPLINLLSEESFSMIQGSTDSEYVFALFMDILEHKENATEEELEQAMLKTIHRIMLLRKEYAANTCAYLNFAVTDGYHTIATRFATCQSYQPASLFYGQGVLLNNQGHISFKKSSKSEESCIIICSEPLTEDKNYWQKVERNYMVKAKKNIDLEQTRIDLPYQNEL